MYRPETGKILKYAAYGALVFLTYVLQGMVFTHLELFGTKPVLLPVLAVAIAVFEGSEIGGIYGLACGIFCDLSFNQATVVFTIALTVIAAAVGILRERLLEKSLVTCLICSLGALIITAALQVFGPLVYLHANVFSLMLTAIIQTIYSILFAVPMYYLCRAIHGLPDRT